MDRPLPIVKDAPAHPGWQRWRFWVVLAMVALALVGLATYRALHQTPQPAVSKHQGQQAGQPAAGDLPSFDVVRISRGGTGVIAGRAAPGAKVAILVNGKTVGEVTADARGEWVFILEEPLLPGTAELSLKAVLPDTEAGTGNRPGARAGEKRTVESDDVVVVSIPKRAEPERFAADRKNGVLAVLTPKNGEGASRVLQRPGTAAPGEIGEQLAVDTIDYGQDRIPVFAGRGVPRAVVRIYLDNVYLGDVRVDDNGHWELKATQPLVEGEHVLRLDQLLPGSDNVELRVLQPFSTGAAPDPSRAKQAVVVRPGNTLWGIARKLYGRGVRYTLIFQENAEQIADPDLIYPGQVFKVPSGEREEGEPERPPAP
ncbi:MAG: LysM peptidoglycan-binding domain-containing protein [Alphaproteobacteria bacterium]|nr:MAG: LysM peptidoglycan-binding domain-containing protein [Alphaproteobacteria bacterium]